MFQKWQEFGEFWPEHSKICTLIVSYCAKYLTFDLRKYRGVIFHDNEEWCKTWRKTDLWFGKWYEEFGKFSPEHSKVSKLGLWWGPFVQSRKCMSLKFTQELCVMTVKNDTKIEEELTCHFKTDMRNFTSFDPNTWKSSKFEILNGFHLTNVYNFWAKEVQRSCLSWHWRVMQNLKKNWPAVWKMIWGIWQIFTKSTRKCRNWVFDGVLLSKVENVWA